MSPPPLNEQPPRSTRDRPGDGYIGKKTQTMEEVKLRSRESRLTRCWMSIKRGGMPAGPRVMLVSTR